MYIFPIVCLFVISVIMNFSVIQLLINYGPIQDVVETITKTDIVAHIVGFLIGLIFPYALNRSSLS